jgi:hypothetical protein
VLSGGLAEGSFPGRGSRFGAANRIPLTQEAHTQTMSKKSERNAQVQKHRIAQPLKGERKVDVTGATEKKQGNAPGLESRAALPKWLVITGIVTTVLAAFSCLSVLISLIAPPSVPLPSPIFGSIVPQVEIVNPNLLPIYRVDSACDLTSVADQSGFAVPPRASSSEKKTTSVLYRGQKIPVDCRGEIDLRGIRVKSTEFRVSISYFPLGWPFRRHTEYVVKGAFDTQGYLLRWMVQ